MSVPKKKVEEYTQIATDVMDRYVDVGCNSTAAAKIIGIAAITAALIMKDDGKTL